MAAISLRRLAPETLFIATAAGVLAVIWIGGLLIWPDKGKALSGNEMGLLALVTVIVTLIAALGILVSARGGGIATGPHPAFRQVIGPSVLASVSGRVIALNTEMTGLIGSPNTSVQALLGSVVEADARMIYTLARSAATLGFAFEEVRDQAGDQIHYLVARAVNDEQIIWSILSPAELRAAMPASISDRYESAPFCHASIEDGRVITTNVRFRGAFGAEQGRELDPSLADALSRPGRYVLPRIDGSFSLMRSFISIAGEELAGPLGSPSDQGKAGGGRRDVFLFDLGGDLPGRSGSEVGLEDVPAAVLQIDGMGRLVWLNAAARRMLGGRASPGVDLATLIEHRGRPLSSLIDEAILGEQAGSAETVRILNGTEASFAQISVARVDAEGEEQVLAVLTDASELRQLEDKFEQSQKMEAVGKLAGGVAHDFNNLLTAINGHCDLLLLGRDASQPDHADLTQIKQNANRAAALVRQLLAFSRKQTLNPALVTLKDVVTDTLYLLDRLIGDRVVLVLDHARESEDAMVRADRQQLEQALMNLVVNARDAMPDGGTVTISTRPRHFVADEQRLGSVIPAGDYVELAVADEGTGIEEAVIGKVFDPFFTTKPLGEGTGLGLSTVYGIVKQSGGFIFAENRPEGGACFRILLAKARAGEAQAAADNAEAEPERPDLTGRASVLLVEDEASVRSVAMRALGLRGFQVTAVESAREALDIVMDPTVQIDLIISDVMMPGMDGPTFAKHARDARPGIRVLFISGYAEDAFRKNMEDPDYAFLAKPFSIAELTAKVKEVLA